MKLANRCPRCGAATLFAGMIKFAPRCANCGLNFNAFNVGDGPAAFLTLIVGTLVMVAAIALELLGHPRFWVHLLVWPGVTLALVIFGLRVAKSMLMAAEYRNAAREGKIAP